MKFAEHKGLNLVETTRKYLRNGRRTTFSIRVLMSARVRPNSYSLRDRRQPTVIRAYTM